MCLCRLDKEKRMYEKEVVDQQGKVDKMKAEGKDEYDIRKQVCSPCNSSAATSIVHLIGRSIDGVCQHNPGLQEEIKGRLHRPASSLSKTAFHLLLCM